MLRGKQENSVWKTRWLWWRTKNLSLLTNMERFWMLATAWLCLESPLYSANLCSCTSSRSHFVSSPCALFFLYLILLRKIIIHNLMHNIQMCRKASQSRWKSMIMSRWENPSFSILIKQNKSTKQAICVTTLGKLSPLCGQRREFGIEREIGSNSSTKSHPTDIQLAQYSFITGRMERHTKTVICNRKHLTSVKTKEASVLGYLKLTVFLASRERGKIKRKEKEEFLSRPLSQVACQLSATCTTLDL